jgi:hypothetical protein
VVQLSWHTCQLGGGIYLRRLNPLGGLLMQLRHASTATAAAICLASGLVALPGSAASAFGTSQPTLVTAVPSAQTPNVNNGMVNTIAAVGNDVYLGGTFTSVSPPGNKGGNAITRRYILAFDATTGAVDNAFVPQLNGTVDTIQPGPIAGTLYVGGGFSTVNGSPMRDVALLNASTGKVVGGFDPSPINGRVGEVRIADGHLIIGGAFTTVGGRTHDGLASLNPLTGLEDGYVNIEFTGHHNFTGQPGQSNGSVGPRRMDVSPDGSRLVVIGDFKQVNGVVHDQIAMIDLGSTAATVDPNWNTAAYSATCFSNSYDSYVRGIQFAPDGSYFAVVATGGSGTNVDHTRALCDTVARWETSSTGTDVQPTWVDYTGQDTLSSVAVTQTAIYVGGHQRWLNNSKGFDQAREGAVARAGLGAVDPSNGVPFSWNPGRNPRGAGANSLLATPNGLYVGSDTTYIGDHRYFRGRIAYFPLAGGEQLPSTTIGALPGLVYLAGPSAAPSKLGQRLFDGMNAGLTGTVNDPSGTNWSQIRGAFEVGGNLFYGLSDGNLYERTFDGSTLGTAKLVDPYDDPLWDNVGTGSGNTYQGVAADLYGTEMRSVTGMVWSNGILYYAVQGQSRLRFRYFTPESGIVGTQEFVAGGSVNFASISGMFLSGSTLYYSTASDGNLHAVPFAGGSPSASSSSVVSGPGVDGVDWHSHGMFLLRVGS